MAKYWKRKANVNLVPLIDVLVNLVFFFVVFGSLGVGTAALPVNLPSSSTAPPSGADRLVVAIDSSGRYFVDGHQVASKDVPRKVADALVDNPHMLVVVFPDRKVPYETLVAALDLVREGGAERPSLGVQPEKEAIAP